MRLLENWRTTAWARGRASLLAPLSALASRVPVIDRALLVGLGIGVLTLNSALGTYLNKHLFLDPLMKIQGSLDLQPRVPADLKIIVADDRSLDRLRHYPSLSEWEAIANQLFEMGYEKVFLLGIHNLESEIGRSVPRHAKGTLILGSVAALGEGNQRTIPLARLPKSLLTRNDDPETPSGLPKSLEGFSPGATADFLRHGDLVGNLNNQGQDDATMYLGFDLSPRFVLPSIGLLAVDGLHWHGATAANGLGAVPSSEDGSVYIDFVSASSAYGSSLPVDQFFSADGRDVLEALPSRLLERLGGGKLAVLVPEGYTGSRFVETPYGKVLSYVAIVSMINSTLRGRFLHRPEPFIVISLALLPLIYLLARGVPRRWVWPVGVGVPVAIAAAAVGTYATWGWVVPCVPLVGLHLVAIGIREAVDAFASATEQIMLRRDLEMGKIVQQTLLPAESTGIVGPWEYRIKFQPHGFMAGDWFQIFRLPEGAPALAVIAIGDVVGKGPSAALITALIAGVWADWKYEWSAGNIDVPEFLGALRRCILDTFKGEQNTTLSLAVLRESSVDVVSAASPSWLHLKGCHAAPNRVRCAPLDPLGLAGRGKASYSDAVVTVEPGDHEVLMAYTDGVMDGKLMERSFGVDVMAAHVPFDSPQTLEILEQVATQAGIKKVLPDDFTLLLIRRLPRPVDVTMPRESAIISS